MAEDAVRPGPLAGLLVADFSRVLAGPYCTMLLADLGADVIKVESPGGDDTRGWVPPTRDGVATYYLAINRNKRSVALDLKEPAGRAAAGELARRADIMVQNFKPGGLARFGLDYDAVRGANPGIIYASITGFGTTGGAHLPGYDLMAQAVSGLMSLTGDADGPPQRAGISVIDVMTGLHTAIAILAALHHRSATGEGQHVEATLLGAVRDGEPDRRLRRRGSRPVPHGQLPSQPDAVRAAPHGGRRTHRHGRQRPAVPPAMCGDRGTAAGRRPAVRHHRRPHRPPGAASAAAGRAPGDAAIRGMVRPADRGRRTLRPDQHGRRRRRVRPRHRAAAGRHRGRPGRAHGPAPG